jgi:outer membrane protein assembly factor BamB
MGEKLDDGCRPVNRPGTAFALLALVALGGCGPSPRPVTPTAENAWPTPLGNTRRAAFEDEIAPETLAVAWDVNAGSGLRASVLVTDSAVFVGTTNRQVLAFSTETGRRHWDQRVEGEIGSDMVRSGRTLFLTTTEWNGRLHARDVERGRRVWRHDIGPARHSPLVEGGIVYAATDAGRVFALRSEDGEQIWRVNLHGAATAPPLSLGDALIVGTASDTLYRVSKRDGSVVRRAHLASSLSAPPAASGDLLVVVTHAGSVLGLDANSLATLWQVAASAPILAAPVIGSDGRIHVLDRDGVIWRIVNGEARRVTALNGAVTSAFTLARDRYVVGMVDGTVKVLDLDGRVIAEHKFNDSVSAPIAVRGRALYVPLLHGRIVKLQQANR